MNTVHPLERLNLARRATRRRLIEAFLEDQTISPKERAVLDEIAMQDEELADYRARQVAAQSFERNGHTRLTHDRFHDAGFQMIDLDAARQERRSNVVAFPVTGKQHA